MPEPKTPSTDGTQPHAGEATSRTCAVHPDAPATFSCPRCGAFACSSCAVAETSLCAACVERVRRPRKVLVAVLLSVVCPGLGLVYVGRLRRAVLLQLVTAHGLGACMVFGAYHVGALFGLMWVGLGLYAAAWLTQLTLAVRRARQTRMTYVLKPYNRLAAYLLYFVLATSTSSASNLISRRFVEPFKTPSGSMLPTLLPGDQLFVVKTDEQRPSARGDIVVFDNPVRKDVVFIKRIVGIPGDRIRLVHHEVQIDGAPQLRRELDPHYRYWNDYPGPEPRQYEETLLEEDLGGVVHGVLEDPTTCDAPTNPACNYEWDDAMGHHDEIVVPAGTYFVMGDHRDSSADSRFGFGLNAKPVFLPEAFIKGRPVVIWFSWSAKEGIRWKRMGMRL